MLLSLYEVDYCSYFAEIPNSLGVSTCKLSRGIGQMTTMSENGSAIADDCSCQKIERLAKLECHIYNYIYI